MKIWLLVGAIALPFLAMAAPSSADDGSSRCSNANLKGRYGVTSHGVVMGVYDKATPPAIHYYDTPLIVDQISDETFDGRRNNKMSYLTFSNGRKLSSMPLAPVEEFNTTGTGSYTVNAIDCTGFVDVAFAPNPNFPTNPLTINRSFVLSSDGKTVRMLWTEVHFPNIVPSSLPAGVTCAQPTGCDLAVQIQSVGERY